MGYLEHSHLEAEGIAQAQGKRLFATHSAGRVAVVAGRNRDLDASAIEIWDIENDTRRAQLLPTSSTSRLPEPVMDVALSADGGVVLAEALCVGRRFEVGERTGLQRATRIAFETSERGQNLVDDMQGALVSEDCFTCRELPDLEREAESELNRARVQKPD